MHSWDVTVYGEDGGEVDISFICTAEELDSHINDCFEYLGAEGVGYRNFHCDLESGKYVQGK